MGMMMSIKQLVEDMEFESFRKEIKSKSLKELQKLKTDINEIKLINFINFEIGVKSGWWEDWNKKEPIPFPIFADLEVLNSQGLKFMSQLLVRLEVFSSISEAKKAGWGIAIERGEFFIKHSGFKKIRIIVE